MKPNEIDYMNRYIYHVTRRLPKEQREEVRMELEELISDMYADKGSMDEVLTELGDPAEFAKQYQDKQRYLIGPEYFDTYLWFLKVVLICSTLPILAVSLVNTLGELPVAVSQNEIHVIIRAIIEGLISGTIDAAASCISILGSVTLIFAIVERKKIQIEMKKAEKWSVESLSEGKKVPSSRWTPNFLEPVPGKKALISRGDSIASIVFLVIFSVLMIFSPNFFSVIFKEGETITSIPFFNLDQWGTILPLILICLVVGLIDEILRLITGVYCKLVMISSIVCGIIQLALSVVMLKVLPMLNPNFVSEINLVFCDGGSSSSNLLTHWNTDALSSGILTIIVVAAMIEIGTTIYKTLRYGAYIRK